MGVSGAGDGGGGPIPKALRAEWKIDRFYTRYTDAGGVPVVASRRVCPRALSVAARIVLGMTVNRPQIRAELVKARIRVAVIGKTELPSDLPEYTSMRREGMHWNFRGRGFGPTRDHPVTSCGEENVLRLRGDAWPQESVLVHEFAHAIMDFGLPKIDPQFERRLHRLYTTAVGRGLWVNTYAATNWGEYWAEGVQSYFDANPFRWIADGIHNGIDTRAKLRRYDPALYRLIDESLHSPKWSWQQTLPAIRS